MASDAFKNRATSGCCHCGGAGPFVASEVSGFRYCRYNERGDEYYCGVFPEKMRFINVKNGFDVTKPHHSESKEDFKSCRISNCGIPATKSVHEKDGAFSFYCDGHWNNPLEIIPMAFYGYCHCYTCKRLTAWHKTLNKEILKCYSCGKSAQESSDEIFKSLKKEDAINGPSHYNKHPSGIECIVITQHFNFNIGNAIKYLWRAGLKNDLLEDLKKARWYVDKEIERLAEAKKTA